MTFTLPKIDSLEPTTARLCRRLIALCAAEQIPIFVTSTYRSWEEQAELYAQGRTKPGAIVTNAQPGESWHNFRRAFDIAFRGEKPYVGPWERVGRLGELIGLAWGGRWKKPDRPHFEYAGGLTLAQARTEHERTHGKV